MYISYKLERTRVEGSFTADYHETKDRIGVVETPVVTNIIKEADSGTFDRVIEEFEENRRYCSGFLSMVNLVLVSLQYNTLKPSYVTVWNFAQPIMHYRNRCS